MLRLRLAAGSLAAALLSLTGCGSDTVTPQQNPDPTQQGDQTGAVPPEPPPEKPGDGEGVVLAADQLFLGETNRDGTPNKASGWRQYGYNLDAKISSPTSTDVCKPAANAAVSTVYPDGDQGIDNSFGKNILPIIVGLEPAPSTAINESINSGDFTVMLSIEGLGADTSYNPLVTKLYGGAALGSAPLWDGTDAWPVFPELLEDPTDITTSKVVFPQSYVTDNIWVSGTDATINLNLTIQGFALGLTISNAIITMELAGDHASAVNGTIAGVLETEVLIEELQKVVGAFDTSLCEGSTIEGILNQIRQASDILKDGTQDPSKTCDGISIGIGFTAKQVRLGEVAPPSTGADDPCAAPMDGG